MLFLANKRAVSKFSTTILSVTFMIGLGHGAVAQPKPAPEPAIWTMSDENTTIHLFGYTQVLQPEMDWQGEAYKKALKSADTVILESYSSDPTQEAAVQKRVQEIGLYRDGKTLSSVLSPKESEEIGAVTQSMGVPLAGLNALKPWLASIQLGVISVTKQGYDLAHPPSGEIAKFAEANDKHIKSFEGPTELMEKMATFPVEEQVQMLVHNVRTLRDDPDQLQRLNKSWLQGDVATIGEILHGGDGSWSSDFVYQSMLVERNKSWRDEIISLMDSETGTVFIAVGLGHLAGKDSLIKMLRAEGFSVTRG